MIKTATQVIVSGYKSFLKESFLQGFSYLFDFSFLFRTPERISKESVKWSDSKATTAVRHSWKAVCKDIDYSIHNVMGITNPRREENLYFLIRRTENKIEVYYAEHPDNALFAINTSTGQKHQKISPVPGLSESELDELLHRIAAYYVKEKQRHTEFASEDTSESSRELTYA